MLRSLNFRNQCAQKVKFRETGRASNLVTVLDYEIVTIGWSLIAPKGLLPNLGKLEEKIQTKAAAAED